jgi:hypothetical protein
MPAGAGRPAATGRRARRLPGMRWRRGGAVGLAVLLLGLYNSVGGLKGRVH